MPWHDLSALVEVVEGLLDDPDGVLADVLPLLEAGNHLLVHVALDEVVRPLLGAVQPLLYLQEVVFLIDEEMVLLRSLLGPTNV